ncbi:MAG: tyrosine-type recombinase/integrase [Candidatus Binatia bacterium]
MTTTLVEQTERALTAPQFRALSAVPPELEWFANITNPRTRVAYEYDVKAFARFVGIQTPEECRLVTRAHVIAWRKELEGHGLADASIRRKLSALSSFFDGLCERNAVADNPVHGVERPRSSSHEGLTPALSDAQARRLLNAPDAGTLKGKRDRAILSTLAHHALRRAELCGLRVKDVQQRHGLVHLRIHGKRGKIRFIPMHPETQRILAEYLEAAGHGQDLGGPLFRPVKNNTTGTLRKALDPRSVLRDVVQHYAKAVGLSEQVQGLCTHSLRATGATNALEHGADIAEVQAWLGHADISTTRLYDHRRRRPEESPTFRVRF